jgi:nucleoside-diphosphate-sugar epimerase
MRIMVTGISGYAGFYAAIRLAAAGHAVVGVARRPALPRLEILRMHQVEVVAGDVGDPGSYRDLAAASDVVIHTMLDKARPLDADRALFATLAALPKRAGAPRRLIYTTGCSIFGKVDVPIIDETTEPNPEHPLAFRRMLEKEALALDLSVVVLRPGFMYGNDGYNSVSTDWFAMAEAGEPVFRGDRSKGWSWVHIDDLAEAYRLVAEAGRGIDGELFCLADEQRPRCVDVMRGCLAAAGCTAEIRFEPPQRGDNVSTWFDQNEFITSAKARRLLGWTPGHLGVLDDLPAAYASWQASRRLGALLSA